MTFDAGVLLKVFLHRGRWTRTKYSPPNVPRNNTMLSPQAILILIVAFLSFGVICAYLGARWMKSSLKEMTFDREGAQELLNRSRGNVLIFLGGMAIVTIVTLSLFR